MLKLRKFDLNFKGVISYTTRFCSNKSNSNDDNDVATKKTRPETSKPIKKNTAVDRLNNLLSSMKSQEEMPINNNKPGAGVRKRLEAVKEQAANKNIFVAAKQVADLIDNKEESKQTEMELLAKLLNQTTTVNQQTATQEKSKGGEQSLSDLLTSMHIDRNKERTDLNRSEFVRRAMQHKKQRVQEGGGTQKRKEFSGSVNLFGVQPLGIFKNVNELREIPDILKTWDQLQKHALQLQITHPPANYFEKIARWTEQGRVWHYPIDNEQNWQDEFDVDFTEHIFLEQHLEPWCPNRGPLRHFMELVCVGLSKNYFLTAKEKQEHIFWYRDYFEQKKELLQDIIKQPQSTPTESNNKTQSLTT